MITNTRKLRLLCGPMMACKTSELLRSANRLSRCNKNKCLWVHNLKDTRSKDADKIFTNGGERDLDDRCTKQKVQSLQEVQLPLGTTHIFIDEAQFYAPEEVQSIVIDKWYLTLGLDVTLSALTTDFRSTLWPSVALLFRFAEIEHFTAICEVCGSDATMTAQRVVAPQNLVNVGGAEKYQALCVHCYVNHTHQ